MNAVLSLCHFCESHGPSVLFSTQAFHFAGEESSGKLEPSKIQFFGPLKKLKEYSELISQNVNSIVCEACKSNSGYITNDYQDKISFLSTRFAVDSNVSFLLKQAAIRSLSCEVVPGKEGQIYFGDSIRGHVLSHSFFLKDAQARGFHRWYSVVVFMRDKHFLLNSWPFFEKHIKEMVLQLQNKASQVYTNEQNERSQRALRLSCPNHRQTSPRSLSQLTASPTVFAQLHLWFTWLLSSGAKRLEEHLPTRPIECRVQESQAEEGFIIVEEVQKKKADVHNEETVALLRNFRKTLGVERFQNLLHSLLVGHQVLVRGPKCVVVHIINLLRFLLPRRKFCCIEFTDTYQTPDVCNVIGLDLSAAVPKPSSNIIRLDAIPSQEEPLENQEVTFDAYQFWLKTVAETFGKLPTLLSKIDKALSDESLSNRVVFLHISSLIEEWTNTIDVLREVEKRSGNHDITGLLQCLGVQEQDDRLVEFWKS